MNYESRIALIANGIKTEVDFILSTKSSFEASEQVNLLSFVVKGVKKNLMETMEKRHKSSIQCKNFLAMLVASWRYKQLVNNFVQKELAGMLSVAADIALKPDFVASRSINLIDAMEEIIKDERKSRKM